MSAKVLRVGVVGCGRCAQDHLQAYQKEESANLVAVADTAEGLARSVAEQFGCTPYTDYRQMIEREQLDAISICTPPVTHADIMLHALPEVHVLCEKPLTIDLDDAKRVLAAVDRSGHLLMMASKFRFVEDVVKAKGIIESGILGKLVLFENVFCSRVDMRGRWNSRKEIAGGGVLFDNGTHSVDIARFLTGPIASVQAQHGIQIQDFDVEDTCRMYFQGVSGVQGTIDLSWSIHKETESFISVFGTDGTLQIGWRQSRYRQSEKLDWVVFGNGYNKQKTFGNQIRHFLAAARGEETPIIRPIDALESVRVIEAAYRSSGVNKWMELAPMADESNVVKA